MKLHLGDAYCNFDVVQVAHVLDLELVEQHNALDGGRWVYLHIISDYKSCVCLCVTSCNCRSFRQKSRKPRLWRFTNLFGHRERSAFCTIFTSIPCHCGSPPTTKNTAHVVSDRTQLNTLNAQKRACTVARCRSRDQKILLAAIIQDTGA